jgi:hypothetical protein
MGSELWSVSHCRCQEPRTLPAGRPRRCAAREALPPAIVFTVAREKGESSLALLHIGHVSKEDGREHVRANTAVAARLDPTAQSTDEGGDGGDVWGSMERLNKEAKMVGLSDEYSGGGARPSSERDTALGHERDEGGDYVWARRRDERGW